MSSADTMRIEVKLFGPAAAEAGADRVGLDCPAGSTADAIRSRLAEIHPALATMARAGRLAINGRYTDSAQPITQHDEVALITLVSGG